MKDTFSLLEEVIIEILMRLPVKSLVRFKCVCKSWFSLISDPHFASSHFELAAARTHRLLFLAQSGSDSETRSIDLDAASFSDDHDDSAFATIKLNFLLPPTFIKSVVGSCRGFLFLDCNTNLFLWNPSTGVHNLYVD